MEATATPCPACGRTSTTTVGGRCTNCAQVKIVVPAPPVERETWGDLLQLGVRGLPHALVGVLVALIALANVAVALAVAVAIGLAYLAVSVLA